MRLIRVAAATAAALVALVGCAPPSRSPASPPPAAQPKLALCEPSEPECIGPLAPGVHRTTNLLTPVTFKVPHGWRKELDVPGSFQIVSTASPTGQVGIRPDWAIANQRRCSRQRAPGLGRSVGDLVTWLTEHPGLITSRPKPVALGGLEGRVLEVRKDPEWSGPCPGRVSLFTHVGTINDPGWWDVSDSARLRLYFLDAGDGHTVTVHVETSDTATFEDFLEVAMHVVESFDFVEEKFDFGPTP